MIFEYLKYTGKAISKQSLHGKTAASVLLKLFISENERCHSTHALAHERDSIFKCKQHTIQYPWGPGKILLPNDEVRGDILQPPHRHLTPAVVSVVKLCLPHIYLLFTYVYVDKHTLRLLTSAVNVPLRIKENTCKLLTLDIIIRSTENVHHKDLVQTETWLIV